MGTKAGKKLKIKIGAWEKPEGYITVDIDPDTKPHVLADARKMKFLKSSSVDEILCEHVLEHIQDTMAVMKEFHRVLKPNGTLKILVPHGLSPGFWSTPDHIKGFTYTTFNQFWQPSHRGYPKFKCTRRKLIMHSSLFQPLANRWPGKIEYLYWFFQPKEIHAELEPIK